jgi:hypothetical protein
MKAQRGVELQLYYFYNFGARWEVVVERHNSAVFPPQKRPSTHFTGGLVSRRVWMDAENLALTGIPSPDLPNYNIPAHNISIFFANIYTLWFGTIWNSRSGIRCRRLKYSRAPVSTGTVVPPYPLIQIRRFSYPRYSAVWKNGKLKK